jgi:hypothetical protein
MKHQLDPDEVFLDASNLPRFNLQQFEGWMERPISANDLFVSSFSPPIE